MLHFYELVFKVGVQSRLKGVPSRGPMPAVIVLVGVGTGPRSLAEVPSPPARMARRDGWPASATHGPRSVYPGMILEADG